MALTAQQERYPNSEHWSLAAEKDFLNRLGTHRGTDNGKMGRTIVDPERRQQLLELYIKAAKLRRRRPQWWPDAVRYAQCLLEEEIGL